MPKSNAEADFQTARLRLIHEWDDEGRSIEEITARLNHHDEGQVMILCMTPVDLELPGTVYAQLAKAEAEIRDLKRKRKL